MPAPVRYLDDDQCGRLRVFALDQQHAGYGDKPPLPGADHEP
jgi:hypothetical protein